MTKITPKEGYKEAINLLKKCSSKYGFYASIYSKDNYKRIWSRDGVISGLAGLITNDNLLIETFKKTLDTLKKYQGPNGEIPSNVDAENGKVSYGMSAGRVDSAILYVIGCSKYYKKTKDDKFLSSHYKAICKTIKLLECWEFNRRDFIFVPESGDWADETPRRGYILYDQILYYMALKEFIAIKKVRGDDYLYWNSKVKRFKNKIKINFWPEKVAQKDKQYIYHKETFSKIKKGKEFWIESFNPKTKRFDALANILMILSKIPNKEQNSSVINYIKKISNNDLIPAFYPVITKSSKNWNELKTNYSFSFTNKPYLSHNGGFWPMVNGFYISALKEVGEDKLANKYIQKITDANYLHPSKQWGFFEYLHGKNKTPNGVPYMAWSAAGQIFAFKSKKII